MLHRSSEPLLGSSVQTRLFPVSDAVLQEAEPRQTGMFPAWGVNGGASVLGPYGQCADRQYI